MIAQCRASSTSPTRSSTRPKNVNDRGRARSPASTTAAATSCASCSRALVDGARHAAPVPADRGLDRLAAAPDRVRPGRRRRTCATPSSAATARTASSTRSGRRPGAGRCGWTPRRRRPCAPRCATTARSRSRRSACSPWCRRPSSRPSPSRSAANALNGAPRRSSPAGCGSGRGNERAVGSLLWPQPNYGFSRGLMSIASP